MYVILIYLQFRQKEKEKISLLKLVPSVSALSPLHQH